MKNINKIIVAILLLFTMSCSEDFLETSPTDSVSPQNALSTPENMLVALNGVHRTMYAQSEVVKSSYAGESYILPMLEFNAGDMLHSSSGNGWFRNHAKWLITTNPNRSDISFVWQNYYYIIGSVNAIINSAEGMAESELLNNVLGQAYAYRAYAHHRLVSMFAKSPTYNNPETDLGVPIMLKTAAPYEGLSRATVEQVYKQTEADIQKAIEYLGKGKEINIKSNISLKTAYGIAARIALTKGDYANAATYANKARKGLSLMSEAEYKSGFNSITNPEWMWGAEVIDDQTNYYYSWFYYIGTNNNGSQNRGNPKIINKNLFSLISQTDYRREMWLPKAPNSSLGWEKDPNYETKEDFNNARKDIIEKYSMTSRFYTHPYMSVKFLNKDGGTINPDDVLYMRASEMYLVEAEALARQGGKDAEAKAIINELGKARDKSYDINARGLSLIEEIKVQRRIELWGEGHRWLDLMRYDEGFDLTGSGASSTLYQKGFQQDKPSESNNWLYQIPQDEIDANPNMKQNPTPTL